MAPSIFREGCPGRRLTLKRYQQAQTRLATGAGGSRLPSTEARIMSASIGSRVGILPEVRTDLTGPLRDKVRRGFPESSNIAQLGVSLRELRDIWGVMKETTAGIVPGSCLE